MLIGLTRTIFIGMLAAGCATMTANESAGFNAKVLTAVRTMPSGGGYDGSDATKNLLHGACDLTDGKIREGEACGAEFLFGGDLSGAA